MILSATRVAQWWRYKTQHQQDVQLVEKQWLESGQHQPLSSTAEASIQQEDNATIKRVVMGRPSKL